MEKNKKPVGVTIIPLGKGQGYAVRATDGKQSSPFHDKKAGILAFAMLVNDFGRQGFPIDFDQVIPVMDQIMALDIPSKEGKEEGILSDELSKEAQYVKDMLIHNQRVSQKKPFFKMCDCGTHGTILYNEMNDQTEVRSFEQAKQVIETLLSESAIGQEDAEYLLKTTEAEFADASLSFGFGSIVIIEVGSF